MNDKLLIMRAWVQISSYRCNVMKAIGEDVKIPSEIVKDSNIIASHISRILNELKQKELVECINEEARKGRLYRLTDKGMEVYKILR